MTGHQSPNSVERRQTTNPVLAVDLDGTLVATDTLWESLLLLVRRRTALALLTPFWFLLGRAGFKRRLAEAAPVDASSLRYNPEVVELLRAEHTAGREIVLATASDERTAQAVADHIGLFDAVLASDGSTNLLGWRRRDALRVVSGNRGFDYIGDSNTDIPVWHEARIALVVNASRRLVRRLRRECKDVRVLGARRQTLAVWLKALRVQQWAKNLLLFAPVLAAHEISLSAMWEVVWAFFGFSLCASGGYLVNDLLDLESDRVHPEKQSRPLASGVMPLPRALAAAPLLFAVAFALSLLTLPPLFTGALAGYSILTISYSVHLKRIVIVDVLTLSALYTLRVLAGAVAAAVPASDWMLAFSMFLFLSLAFVKRYSEVAVLREQGVERTRGRDYAATDLELVRALGAASGYLAVLVLALYIKSDKVVTLYRRPEILWLVEPLLLYWITRMWFIASRNRMHSDPVVFALKDRTSHIVAGMTILLALFAA